MLSERRKLWAAISVLCLVAFAAGSARRRKPKPLRAPAGRRLNGRNRAGTQNPIDRFTHSQRASGPAERVQYVGPETYILRDAQGRPQAMPGMTYEDFLAAWKRLQQVDGGAPSTFFDRSRSDYWACSRSTCRASVRHHRAAIDRRPCRRVAGDGRSDTSGRGAIHIGRNQRQTG